MIRHNNIVVNRYRRIMIMDAPDCEIRDSAILRQLMHSTLRTRNARPYTPKLVFAVFRTYCEDITSRQRIIMFI